MPQFCKLQAAQQEQQIHAPNGLAGLELLFSSVDLHKQKTRSTHQNKSGFPSYLPATLVPNEASPISPHPWPRKGSDVSEWLIMELKNCTTGFGSPTFALEFPLSQEEHDHQNHQNHHKPKYSIQPPPFNQLHSKPLSSQVHPHCP